MKSGMWCLPVSHWLNAHIKWFFSRSDITVVCRAMEFGQSPSYNIILYHIYAMKLDKSSNAEDEDALDKIRESSSGSTHMHTQVNSLWTATTATFSSPAVRSSFMITSSSSSLFFPIVTINCCFNCNWRPPLEQDRFALKLSSISPHLFKPNFPFQLVMTQEKCC